jgi:MoxR-like ATPase
LDPFTVSRQESRLSQTLPDSPDILRIQKSLLGQISKVVTMPHAVLEQILVSMIAGGHILLEGIPGIGKTLLARSFASCLDCSFHRIQFTNDLMPSDILGSSIWNPGSKGFEFVRGPLFANLVLADEINRTSPRTLSCLLEAMENGRVTIDGNLLELGRPFMVMATRNPIEFHGTFPLPEAALDRFLMRIRLAYPGREEEMSLYLGRDSEAELAKLDAVLHPSDLLRLQEQARAIEVRPPIAEYVFSLVDKTRHHSAVLLGASPRAALTWIHAARARACLHGRDYVLPDDLKALADPVLSHRIFLEGGGDAGGLLHDLLSSTHVPL